MASDGNSPTHIAVTYNHISVLELLINFGANILALNLKMITPLKLAAELKRMECYRLLDATIARWETVNPSHVQKLQSKAMENLKKNVKKMEEGGKRRHLSVGGYTPQEGSLTSLDPPATERGGSKTLPARGRHATESDLHHLAQRMHTLSRMTQKTDELSAGSLSDDEEHMPGDEEKVKSLKVFPHSSAMISALKSIPEKKGHRGTDVEDPTARYISGHSSESGSTGVPHLSGSDVPENLHEGSGARQPVLTENDSPLVTFLTAFDLGDITEDLLKEKMDIQSLMMCSDTDLHSAGIALGPRKKILAAIKLRQELLSQPGRMTDVEI